MRDQIKYINTGDNDEQTFPHRFFFLVLHVSLLAVYFVKQTSGIGDVPSPRRSPQGQRSFSARAAVSSALPSLVPSVVRHSLGPT